MPDGTIRLGRCTFDPATASLRGADGDEIPLRSQSLRVLSELAGSTGQVVARDALIDRVWTGIAVTDDSLAQCIRDIRRALGDRDHRIVKTVVGRGYRLVGEAGAAPSRSVPGLLVERFDASGTPAMSERLRGEVHAALVTHLTPRAGLKVLTDSTRTGDAVYLVSGTIHATDEGVQVSFQLCQADGRVVVFSDTRTGAGEDIAALAAEVAEIVAAQLRVHMIVHDGDAVVARDDADLSVQELKAKAAWHMARFRRENREAARVTLERARALDPGDPVALAMAASMATQLAPLVPFDETRADRDGALDLANRAVELGQAIDYVLRTRGNIRLWCFGDHDGARRDCERALAMNPAFHLAHLTLAESEILSGQPEAGVERLHAMMRRAPFDPQNPLYFSFIAIGELLSGHPERAFSAARECLDLWPSQPWCARVHAMTACALGRQDIARATAGVRDLPAGHVRDMPLVRAEDADVLGNLEKAALAEVGPPRKG